MAYRLNHLYISPPLFRGDVSHQPACLGDSNLDYSCSDFCGFYSGPGGHFSEYPVPWRYRGCPASVDAGALQRVPASVQCRGNLWDTTAWDPRILQQDTYTFPAPGCLDSYTSGPELGAEEDRFGYLEAHSVSVVGRQLSVRVYREAQFGDFFMQKQVSHRSSVGLHKKNILIELCFALMQFTSFMLIEGIFC